MDDVLIKKSEGAVIISEEYPDMGYLAIPYTILQRKDLKMSEKVVFGLILGFVMNGRRFTASNGWMAKRTGYDVDVVRVALATLEDKSLIIRELGNKTRLEILINPKYFTDNTIQLEPSKGSGKTPQGDVVKPHKGDVGKTHRGDVGKTHTDNQVYNQVKKQDKDKGLKKEYQEFITLFNSLRGTNYQFTGDVAKLYEHQRKSFTSEQILEAVRNIPNHSWLASINYTPTIFLRSNKDWVDQCLNLVKGGARVRVFSLESMKRPAD